MRTLHLMQGPSGSGKSTYVRQHATPWDTVCSADDFFVDSEGIYRFDASRLSGAHGVCQWQAIGEMRARTDRDVWVDNTNTTAQELEPYIRVAKIYGYRTVLHVIGAGVPIETLAKRNQHGVPVGTIVRQVSRLRDIWVSPDAARDLGIDEVDVVPSSHLDPLSLLGK